MFLYYHSSLSINDLKLLVVNRNTLAKITNEVKELFEVTGLEINKEKSTANDTCCKDITTLLEILVLINV